MTDVHAGRFAERALESAREARYSRASTIEQRYTALLSLLSASAPVAEMIGERLRMEAATRSSIRQWFADAAADLEDAARVAPLLTTPNSVSREASHAVD